MPDIVAKCRQTDGMAFSLVKQAAYVGLLASILSCSTAGFAADTPWPLRLRAKIARVTAVGYHLNAAARGMCAREAALTGLSVDYVAAYPDNDRAAISALLGLADLPQIAVVVPNSPAARAGLQQGDDIVSINGTPSTVFAAASSDPGLLADEIEELLGQTPANSMLRLGIRRGDRSFDAAVQPERGCSPRYIIRTGEGLAAYSDPQNIAIGEKMVDFAESDDELALILGHELAHIVHRDAETKRRSRRVKEDRADVLGARLAHCAGYGVETALALWIRYKKRDWLSFLRDPSYRTMDGRIALIRAHGSNGDCPAQDWQPTS